MVYSMVIVVFLALAGSYVLYHYSRLFLRGLLDNRELLTNSVDYSHHEISGTRVQHRPLWQSHGTTHPKTARVLVVPSQFSTFLTIS